MVFPDIFLCLTYSFIFSCGCSQKRCMLLLWSFWICWGLFYGLIYDQFWRISHVYLNIILLFWDEIIWVHLLNLSDNFGLFLNIKFIKHKIHRACEWLSWLSCQLLISTQVIISAPWDWAPHWAPCLVSSLLEILLECLSPTSCVCSLSKINNYII